jgi:ankyrin repeat protein
LHVLCSCNIRISKGEKQINYEIIKFLIENGADIDMKAFNGKKPEELATGHCSMTAILDLIIKRKDAIKIRKEGKGNKQGRLI